MIRRTLKETPRTPDRVVEKPAMDVAKDLPPLPPVVAMNPELQISRRSRSDDKLAGEEAKRVARALVSDPLYLNRLQSRLREGKAAPAVEVHIWHLAYGKPKEQIEVKRATAIKIIHSYDDGEGERIAREVVDGELASSENRSNALEPAANSVPQEQDAVSGLRGSDSVGENDRSSVETD